MALNSNLTAELGKINPRSTERTTYDDIRNIHSSKCVLSYFNT